MELGEEILESLEAQLEASFITLDNYEDIIARTDTSSPKEAAVIGLTFALRELDDTNLRLKIAQTQNDTDKTSFFESQREKLKLITEHASKGFFQPLKQHLRESGEFLLELGRAAELLAGDQMDKDAQKYKAQGRGHLRLTATIPNIGKPPSIDKG